MLLDVQVPDAVVLVLQDDGVRLQGVGEDVLHLQLLPLLVLKDDLAHAVYRPDGALPAGQGHVRRAAVEEDHIGLGDHVDDHGLHVGAVHLEGGAVDDVDGLVEPPGLGQLQVPEDLDGPHAVVLQEHPLRLIAAVDLLEKAGVQLGLVLDRDQAGVPPGQLLRIILRLAVLTHQQDGALPIGKIIHIQGVGEQSGLAAVQKAGDEVQRDTGIFHAASPHSAGRR